MALILNIDTAVNAASVCLAKDGHVMALVKNEHQKDHAAWLHVAIKDVFTMNALRMTSVDAVGVTEGPGSYTGLRIGMATAKGICYALNKPLITLNTLLVMAYAAMEEHTDLLCPMIDARRMDVFTALYTKDLAIVKKPMAITLKETSFDTELSASTICFFGNGADKFGKIINNPRAIFRNHGFDASSMIHLSEMKVQQKEYADLAYAEPVYLKEFYTPAR